MAGELERTVKTIHVLRLVHRQLTQSTNDYNSVACNEKMHSLANNYILYSLARFSVN